MNLPVDHDGEGGNEIKMPLILDGKFFKLIHIDKATAKTGSAVTAQCTKCQKRIKGQINATTNFRNHLKSRNHSIQDYENYKESHFTHPKKRPTDNVATESNKKHRQTTLMNNFTRNEQHEADHLITNFIVHTLSPLALVEHQAFINLIRGFNKLKNPVSIMSRKTLSKRVNDDYNKTMTDIKEKLKSVPFVCTTADVWSSSKRSYMGVTAHWINNKCVRESAALACRRFKGSHTFDKIATMISDIHEEFVDKQFTTIIKTVTDNGANMVKAFSGSQNQVKSMVTETHPDCNLSHLSTLLQEDSLKNVLEIDYESDEDQDETIQLSISDIIEPTNYDSFTSDIYLPTHQRCVCHTLSLIITSDIKKAFMTNQNCAYNRMHHLTFAKCSGIWNITSRSPKACETYQKITTRSPTSPCATRWNSTFDCLQSLLKVKDKLNEVCKALNLPKFKESETEFLIEYVEVVRPFADTLDRLQGSDHTFYGELIPELMRIQKILKSLKLRPLQFCAVLVNVLSENFESRFKDYLLLSFNVNDAILASITHPFFKLRWASSEDKSRLKDLLLNEIKQLHSLTETENKINHNISSYDDNYFLFDDGSADCPQSSEKNNSLQLEALQYLQSTATDFAMLDQFPNIKKMFIKYNTPLPSSAPVERLFSYAGMIMRPKRRCMRDDTFEKLLIIKANHMSL